MRVLKSASNGTGGGFFMRGQLTAIRFFVAFSILR
jgi:hypothetical protein